MKKKRSGVYQNEKASPQRRLGALWHWLPAFRATAETGSVSAAARLLDVTPSAVSRSLKMLEAEIGAPLFARKDGASLRLNAAGDALFAQVRAAMRLIDDGLPHRAVPRRRAPRGTAVPGCEPYEDLAVASAELVAGLVDDVLVVGDVPAPVGVEAVVADVPVAWWRRRAATGR